MMFRRLAPLGLVMILLSAAGCAGSPAPERGTGAAASTTAIDPATGQAGPLRLGMTSSEAIAAMGEPEVRLEEFLSWRGGKVTAGLEANRILAIEIKDPSFHLGDIRVGDTIERARPLFPGASYTPEGKLPLLTISSSPYVALQANNNGDAQIIKFHLGERAPENEHED